jgi:hypothetical protein
VRSGRSGKHAPGKDNAQFMLFEKAICCAGIPRHERVAFPPPAFKNGLAPARPAALPTVSVCAGAAALP